MTDRELICEVQNFFDSFSQTVDSCKFADNSCTNSSAAVRMINAYQRFMSYKTVEYQIEFECSLRNYLLFFKTDIYIKDYNLSEQNLFGLMLNKQTGRIYVKLDLPEYVNDAIVRQVFEGCAAKDAPEDNNIKYVNAYIYELTGHKFTAFKSVEQQLAVIGALRVPEGYTAMIAMSTGGGKSLVTQTISYQYKESLTVVIVPTVSLMLDQQKSATKIIEPQNKNEIMYYHSDCNVEELTDAIDKNTVRMLFISPEALIKNKKIQDSILQANSKGMLKNLVIDEAHIVVEWGASFRVDFQCLDIFRKLLKRDNPALRTYLLSATFSKKTVNNLKMFYSDNDRWIEIRLDELRKEPRFDIIKCQSLYEKHRRIKELVCKLPRPMIIYVNSPDDAEDLRKELAKIGFANTRTFTGRTGAADRRQIIQDWVGDKFDLMIATCAFGVGVDKKDVRTIVHLYIPTGPDQYYQECGRGGRDGLPCLSVMLYTDDDINSAVSMMQKVLTVEKLCGRWFSMLSSKKANVRLNSIMIDTSVRPDYNIDEKFYIDVSNTDVSWNVYVILLLRRAGLIEINDVKYERGIYIFDIELVDKRIRYNNEKTVELFNKVRDDESNSIYSEFRKLLSKLRETGKSCWSSMFNETYLLTDEYCAGCNNHNNILTDKRKKFPLKKPINSPVSEPNGKVRSVMNTAREMLVICENGFCKTAKRLLVSGADIIVSPDDADYVSELLKIETTYSAQFCMGYDEFFELSRENNDYYLSGTVVFCIDEDPELAERVLNVTLNKRYNCIYLVRSDFYVPTRNKKISELVNGVCKYDHIIEMELM